MLEAQVDDEHDGSERVTIARAIDWDLEQAFPDAAEQIERQQSVRAVEVTAGIAAWRDNQQKHDRHAGRGSEESPRATPGGVSGYTVGRGDEQETRR